MTAFWRGRRVLVTGHTGFKGSWLFLWLQRLGAEVHGLALPPERDDGAFTAMGLPIEQPVDLRDGAATEAAVARVDPEIILHLAAQALVRRGYADPAGTFATNVQGTANLLDAARRAPSLRAVVVITSDKVYRNTDLGTPRPFEEDDPLGGSDPYSASKASVELLVGAWRAAFPITLAGGAVATARAGNVIGGGDTGQDRLLVDAWEAVRDGKVLVLRYPDAMRPWQFVLEPLAGYLMLAERLATDPGSAPPALNFGPSADDALSVSQLVKRAYALRGGGEWSASGVETFAEARFLQLSSERARATLGWRPVLTVDEALAWTVDWWRATADGADRRALAHGQIEEFDRRMAAR
jgi:CDP-glucose 4,6-dehydratase